ncbi:MAG: CBS domain-containing protein, partial [Candidatus Tectomicrobia bacterium]
NTIGETASLRGAALYLQKQKIGCLPVVRGEMLVRIITDSDFVSVAINLMETLEEQEPIEEEFIEEDVGASVDVNLGEPNGTADAGAA